MILLRSALRNWRVWLRYSTSIYMVPEQFWVRSAIVAQYSSGTPLSQGASSFGGTASFVQPTIPIRVWVFLSWTLWTTFGQSDLITIEKALNKFHSAQEIFCTSSVCQKGFNLPRQHSMVLCSSRTSCST